MKLSNQALGAVMMALQKSLLEQSDIVPVLKDFILVEQDGELMVTNPPSVKFDDLLAVEDWCQSIFIRAKNVKKSLKEFILWTIN